MARKKDIKIILDTYGNYLGMRKGCIILSDKDKNETKYPLVEESIGEIVLNSGNMISTGARARVRSKSNKRGCFGCIHSFEKV